MLPKKVGRGGPDATCLWCSCSFLVYLYIPIPFFVERITYFVYIPVDNHHQKPRSLSCLSFKIIEVILTLLLWWWRGHVLGTCILNPAELQQVMIRRTKRKCSVLLHCHITLNQSFINDAIKTLLGNNSFFFKHIFKFALQITTSTRQMVLCNS